MECSFLKCNSRIFTCLIGILITILGAVFNGQLKLYSNVTEDNYKIESGLMIAAGCFLVLAVCLDECTAKSKNAYLVGMAFLLIILSFIMLLSAGIVACVHVRDLNYKYEDQLIAGLDKYDHSTQFEFSASMDLIQQKYECCGVTNYTDWFNTTWGQLHKNSVPNSCCVTYAQNCGINFETNNITIFQQGCFWPVKESIHGYVTAIACFCIVLFITMLIAQVMLRFIKPSQTEVL